MSDKRPIVTVAAIVTRPSSGGTSEVLLTRRSVEPFKGQMCLPGGHVDFGETAAEAARRELEEETGLELEPSFLFYSDEILPGLDWHAEVLVFHFAADPDCRLRLNESEVDEAAWAPLPEALEADLAFRHREVLERFASES